MSSYDPRRYWQQRLSDRFSLRGVGHISFGESYNRWLYRRKQECIETCLQEVDLAGKSVLDIGCGTGFFVDWYRNHGANVCGVDITDISIARLRQKYGDEFHVQDITAGDFALSGGGFDIVNMWDVIYHIVTPREFAQAIDNIAASLKPSGLLLFTDWFGAPRDKQLADHVQMRCLETYNRILPEKGFELVEILPLYQHLNRIHLRIGKIALPVFDNHLGWLYFQLDNRLSKASVDNLSLGVWRRCP